MLSLLALIAGVFALFIMFMVGSAIVMALCGVKP